MPRNAHGAELPGIPALAMDQERQTP